MGDQSIDQYLFNGNNPPPLDLFDFDSLVLSLRTSQDQITRGIVVCVPINLFIFVSHVPVAQVLTRLLGMADGPTVFPHWRCASIEINGDLNHDE